MPTASDLNEATNFAQQNVQGVFQDAARSLFAEQTTWIAGLLNLSSFTPPTPAATNLDPESANNRTLLNWVVPATFIKNQVPTTITDQQQEDAFEVGLNLFRVCAAARDALSRGDITADQGTAVLTLYNATWP